MLYVCEATSSRGAREVPLEEALPSAEHDRVDHQPELVEQACAKQRADEGGAPGDGHVLLRLLLQLRELAGGSAPRSVEFCQVTSSTVFETTYLGRPLMTSAVGFSSADCRGQYSDHA